MSNVRTVSDTKRSFYALHTRPISSIYRRVVEELMVEMHLLSVNVDFSYDSIYALGVVTTFDRFMQGYRPDQDRQSIFQSLCRSIESDPQQYMQDAENLKGEVSSFSKDSLQTIVELADGAPDGILKQQLHAISNNGSFKYSRLFGIGIYTILEILDADLISDKTKLDDILATLSSELNLPSDKISKDLELYQSNLEKITQAQAVLDDLLQAERKKRDQRQAGDKQDTTQKSDEVDEVSTSPEAQES